MIGPLGATEDFKAFAENNSDFLLKEYQDIYAITGGKDDQTKVQFSFKIPLLAFLNQNIYLAHTQRIYWNLYNTGVPIDTIDFNPALFWRIYLNADNMLDVGFFEHNSNGGTGKKHVGLDGSYLKYQIKKDFEFFSILSGLKYQYIYSTITANADIVDYLTNEFTVGVQLRNPWSNFLIYDFLVKEQFYYTIDFGRFYNFDRATHWLGIKFMINTRFFKLYFYIQGRSGFLEHLDIYNQQSDSIRFGLLF